MDLGEDGWRGRGTRVLMVDDQISVREMVAMVLDRERGYAVVGEAGSGPEGLLRFRRTRPELVIAGLALPELSGPEMIRAMREEAPECRVMIYSGARNAETILAGIGAGAHGFVHKTEPLDVLRLGIAAVAKGSSFFGPFATGVIDEMRRGTQSAVGLSPKLRRVLQLVAEGHSTKQVAGRLSISPKTVEHYRGQLMQKLGLRDVASLTRYAVRCGLVGSD